MQTTQQKGSSALAKWRPASAVSRHRWVNKIYSLNYDCGIVKVYFYSLKNPLEVFPDQRLFLAKNGEYLGWF
jgi:hypothetical protein